MPAVLKSTGADLHEFIRHRHVTGDGVYGVVDAARNADLAFSARDRFDQEIAWLFDDNAASHMADVAPYLVPVPYRSRFPYLHSEYLDEWAARLWNHCGVLLLTPADPAALLAHLRDLFKATDDDGHRYFFRFYDPRVLRTFLPVCTPAELTAFFGPITRILVEAEQPGQMAVHGFTRDGLRSEIIPLSRTPTGGGAS